MSLKIILSALLLIFVFSLIFFSDDRRSKITNYPSAGTDIIAFGDSLVEGVGSSSGGGFVDMLSKDLGVPIINLGKSGDTTATALARIKVLDDYNPKVVIILLGGNDFLRKVPQVETFSNLEAIIDKIHKRGASVLLLGIRGGIINDEYEKSFNDLAKKRGAAYVSNVLRGLLGRTDLMSDAIHPNDKGYRKIADRVRPVLEELLE